MQALKGLTSRLAGWLPAGRAQGVRQAARTPPPASAGSGGGAGAKRSPAAAPAPQLELFIAGDRGAGSQALHATTRGTLLYLREKGVSVEMLDQQAGGAGSSTPWLDQACPGGVTTLPVARELASGRCLSGPSAIWKFCEESFPGGRDLGRPLEQLSGGEVVLGDLASQQLSDSALLGALSTLLSATDEAEVACAQAELKATLWALDDWLAEHEMAFVGGDDPNATDCYLIVQLVHVFAAANLKRAGTLGGPYIRLKRYFEEWAVRDSWQAAGIDKGEVAALWGASVPQDPT